MKRRERRTKWQHKTRVKPRSLTTALCQNYRRYKCHFNKSYLYVWTWSCLSCLCTV